MAVVAYHALFVEVHADGRMQVRTEGAHLEVIGGKLSKVVDDHTASEMGTPQDAADQVTVAARALVGQLVSAPNRERQPLAMEAN